MTNDTSTLNGALQELGETMADNLTTMGVTASASDGLTTLAGKILDIRATLTLTTNKNILSYSDSETCTLTATHSLGAGQSVSVYNAVSGTKIGDATDNQDGTYTYTYNSTGVGDISMTAVSGQTESNSILITDAIFYENTITQAGRYGGDKSWLLDEDFTTNLPTNCEISFKIQTNVAGCRFQLSSKSQYTYNGVSNYGFGSSNNSSGIGAYYRTTSSTGWGTNVTLGSSEHTFKFVKTGGSIEAFVDGTSKGSQTFTWLSNYTDYTFVFWTWASGTFTVSDIVLKTLPTTQ